MKIQGSGPLNTPTIRRRQGARRAEGGGFSVAASGESSVKGAGMPTAVESLSTLLTVQEIDDRPGGGNRQARERAELLLDKLERLRHGLLTGRIPAHELADLARTVRTRRAMVSDPRIAEVLGEIELRAAVELAKLGQNP